MALGLLDPPFMIDGLSSSLEFPQKFSSCLGYQESQYLPNVVMNTRIALRLAKSTISHDLTPMPGIEPEWDSQSSRPVVVSSLLYAYE